MQSSPISVGISASKCFSVGDAHSTEQHGPNAENQNLAVQSVCKTRHAFPLGSSVLPISLHHFALVRSAIVVGAHQVPLPLSLSLPFLNTNREPSCILRQGLVMAMLMLMLI